MIIKVKDWQIDVGYLCVILMYLIEGIVLIGIIIQCILSLFQ